jgi:hypothetical protein
MFVAVVLGVLCAARTMLTLGTKHYPGDFEQVWYAARAILAGNDPYQLIGPGRPFPFDFEFRYPLTAAVVAIPVAPLSADVASGLFVGLGMACLAWVLMRHGHGPLIGFLSASVISVMDSVQWSPLLAAATVIAPLGVLFAAKPTIGLAMFAARPSRWAVVGGLALTAMAFLVQPMWLAEWKAVLPDRLGITTELVLHPGGAIALLCVLRWRRPEARMLMMLVCVPVTPALYETVPLLLIPRRWWESVVLVLASYVVLAWVMRVPLRDLTDFPAHMATSARAIAAVPIPLATLMVLRRPNEGPAPAWLETRLSSWPAWFRGRALPNP